MKRWALSALVGAGAGVCLIGTASAEPVSVAILLQVAVAAVKTLVAVAISAVVTSLTRPKKQEPRGAQLEFSIDPAAPCVAAFGQCRVAGSLVRAWTTGTKNKWDVEVHAIAEGLCEGFVGYWIGDNFYPWVGDGPQPYFSPGGVPHLWIYTRLGADDQTAISGHEALDGIWLDTDRGIGTCHAIIIRLFNNDVFPGDEKPDGWTIKGLKIYRVAAAPAEGGAGSVVWGDPSTYLFTDNALDCANHYARGVWVNGHRVVGPGLTSRELPFARWFPEIAACEELVSLKAGGSEARYRISAVVTSEDDWSEILDEFARSTGGDRIDIGGQQVILAGVSRTTVMDLTEADMSARHDFWVQGKKGANELTNQIIGTFTDRLAGYLSGDYPMIVDTAAQAVDGDVKERVLNLPFVYSNTQAQRVSAIALKRERLQISSGFTGMAWTCGLEAGDWIRTSSTRESWVNQTFLIKNSSVGPSRLNTLRLEQIHSSVYSWNPASDEQDVRAGETSGAFLFAENGVPLLAEDASQLRAE